MPRPFALNGAPDGGPGTEGTFPLLTPACDGEETLLVLDNPLAKGAGGGGTGGICAAFLNEETAEL